MPLLLLSGVRGDDLLQRESPTSPLLEGERLDDIPSLGKMERHCVQSDVGSCGRIQPWAASPTIQFDPSHRRYEGRLRVLGLLVLFLHQFEDGKAVLIASLYPRSRLSSFENLAANWGPLSEMILS